FFQAEDGIRDYKVTGVQTCALPIYGAAPAAPFDFAEDVHGDCHTLSLVGELDIATAPILQATITRLCDAGAKEIVLDLHELTSRSEERRVGKECRSWGCGDQ